MPDNNFRDGSGKALADYPRPSVAVDTALLTADPDRGLMVLEVKRANTSGWGLPGTFLHPNERLADAVRRCLLDKAGVSGVSPHQWRVFDQPDRDDRGWVLSVAHWAVVPPERLAPRLATQTRLVPVDSPGRLIYDHRLIIGAAVTHVRECYGKEPDPEGLLEKTFTLRELRLLHEAIAGHKVDRDWFRREMKSKLRATGTMSVGARGRPAELFTRRTRWRRPPAT
ncbi:MAG: NUDIX domain-containing protein [Actinomycetia bacterium]|nr:NUDIX domain-containing protein [Actinomycetes bacterium]MCH9710968.1 NUDIX domain-containing protein [Actinomycetes bacterium]MCH9768312.1 NUDIX domain-containing protein [Actinomycetes bacterium]